MLGTQTVTAPKRLTDLLKYEVDPLYSRERGAIGTGVSVSVGTLLASLAVVANLTVSFVVGAGNTGNGVLTLASPAASTQVLPGEYRVTFFAEATNLGDYMVTDPEGMVVGIGTVGTAFDGPVKFTIADGANDFDRDDYFVITVLDEDEDSYVHVPWNPSGTDGSQIISAVSLTAYDNSEGEAAIASALNVLKRAARIAVQGVEWPSGVTETQKAAARARLARIGILNEYAI